MKQKPNLKDILVENKGENMKKKLILMGPPGSGKGTISEIIINKFNLPHISTGNALRVIAERKDEFGMKVKKIMDEGALLSDEIVDEIIKDAVSKNLEKGFILDGYPRNITQAEKLISWFEIDEVIVVDISDEEIIERLQGRRTCPKCGASYHIVNIKPKVEGICDVCGSELVRRSDEDKIKGRLEIYHKETEPIIEFLKEKQIKIKKVPGNFNIDTEKDMIANIVEN